jgi:hypothetical protein
MPSGIDERRGMPTVHDRLRPVHEVKVDVPNVQRLERRVERVRDVVVACVPPACGSAFAQPEDEGRNVQLGRHEDV